MLSTCHGWTTKSGRGWFRSGRLLITVNVTGKCIILIAFPAWCHEHFLLRKAASVTDYSEYSGDRADEASSGLLYPTTNTATLVWGFSYWLQWMLTSFPFPVYFSLKARHGLYRYAFIARSGLKAGPASLTDYSECFSRCLSTSVATEASRVANSGISVVRLFICRQLEGILNIVNIADVYVRSVRFLES